MGKKTQKRYKRKTHGAKKNTHNKTKNGHLNKSKSHIVKVFLEVLNMVKLYHWKTHSYAEHKATDELYSKLNEHMDTFVEVLLGKDASRIQFLEKKIELYDFSNILEFKRRIFEFRSFLKDLDIHFNSSHDSDLLNIRDEILSDINQFLYLLTFNK
jgi:DNA-binding ferritin-like protein